jgi:Sec-independent protein translocase protein TatA
VLLLFGAGRISKVVRELGKGMRDFRSVLKDSEGKEETDGKK